MYNLILCITVGLLILSKGIGVVNHAPIVLIGYILLALRILIAAAAAAAAGASLKRDAKIWSVNGSRVRGSESTRRGQESYNMREQ